MDECQEVKNLKNLEREYLKKMKEVNKMDNPVWTLLMIILAIPFTLGVVFLAYVYFQYGSFLINSLLHPAQCMPLGCKTPTLEWWAVMISMFCLWVAFGLTAIAVIWETIDYFIDKLSKPKIKEFSWREEGRSVLIK